MNFGSMCTNAILLLCKLHFYVFSLLVHVTEKDEKRVLCQFSYILLYNPLIDINKSFCRLFDLSSDLEQPEQEFFLQPILTGKCQNASAICPVAFSFGSDHLWDRFSVCHINKLIKIL